MISQTRSLGTRVGDTLGEGGDVGGQELTETTVPTRGAVSKEESRMRFGGIADTVKRMRKSMLCEPLSWTGHTRKWYRFGILECIFSDFVHKRIVSEMRGSLLINAHANF